MIKILELFSGYGTATFALKRLGIEHQVVGYSDNNKYANKCFQQNHGGKELGDVTLIDPYSLGDFDLLTGGFPCQAFSVAGKQLGELDARGTLFNEIIRIAEVKKPKYMLLENVKGLTTSKFKRTFDKIISELDRIGYDVYWKVLNAKNYGIPQSRQRVWFVCFRKDLAKSFTWPTEQKLYFNVKDLLEKEVDEKYYLSIEQFGALTNGKQKSLINPEIAATLQHPGHSGGNYRGMNIIVLNKPIHSTNRLYDPSGVGRTIRANAGGMGAKTGAYLVNDRARRLTPRECFRLMGFLNDEINTEGLSDSQKYKLAGNGQVVDQVAFIFSHMF